MKDPKYNTSLYNHKPIGSIERPLISNAEFQTLLLEVQSGNEDAYREAKERYSIEPKQDKILTDILNNNII